MSRAQIDLLLRACDALGGGDDEIGDFIKYYKDSESDCKVIFDFIVKVWYGEVPVEYMDSEGAIQYPSANDLARVALALPHIAWDAHFECIRCLNKGLIVGKSAMYCLSELQSFLTGYRAQHGSIVEEVPHIAHLLYRAASICLEPFISCVSRSSSSSSGSRVYEGSQVCLELLPTIVSVLVALNERLRMSGVHVTLNEEQTEHMLPMHATHSILDRIIGSETYKNCALYSHVSDAAFISLVNCCCELFPNFSSEHVSQLEQHILFAGTQSTGSDGDTLLVALLRVSLLLQQQSTDIRWVHVLRTLYSHASSGEHSLHVEGILEQLLAQAQSAARMIVCVIEDTGVQQAGAASIVETVDEAIDEAAGIELDKSYCPKVDDNDLRLLLLISRALQVDGGYRDDRSGAGSHLGVENTIALPAIINNCMDMHSSEYGGSSETGGGSTSSGPYRGDSNCGSSDILVHLARCCVVIILCIMQEDKGNDAFCVSSSFQLAVNGVIGKVLQEDNRSSPPWLVSFRTTGLVYLLLHVLSYPRIMHSCLLIITKSSIALDNNANENLCINISSLCSKLLVEVFQVHTASRPALLAVLLRGIVVCAENQSLHAVGNNEQMIAIRMQEEARAAVLSSFLGCLQAVCTVFPKLFHAISHRSSSRTNTISDTSFDCGRDTERDACIRALMRYAPALLHAQGVLPAVLDRFLKAIASITAFSDEIYAAVHSSCRKVLLRHGDVRMQQVAIRALVSTISSNDNSQCGYLEGIQTLLYALSLPLQSKRIVYDELIVRAIHAHRVREQLRSAEGASVVNSCSKLHGGVLFRTLHDRIVEVFGAYFEHDRLRSTASTTIGCVFVPQKCVSCMSRVQDSLIVVDEDIEMVLSLLYSLDCALDGSQAVAADVLAVARRLTNAVAPPSSEALLGSRQEEEHNMSPLGETSIGRFLHGIVTFVARGCPSGLRAEDSVELLATYYTCVHAAMDGLLYCLQQQLFCCSQDITRREDIPELQSAVTVVLALLDLFLESFSNASSDLQHVCENRYATIFTTSSSSVADKDVPVDGHAFMRQTLSAWYFVEDSCCADTSAIGEGSVTGRAPSFSMALVGLESIVQSVLPALKMQGTTAIPLPFSAIVGAVGCACHNVSRACGSRASHDHTSEIELTAVLEQLHIIHKTVCTVEAEEPLVEKAIQIGAHNPWSTSWASLLKKMPEFVLHGIERWDISYVQDVSVDDTVETLSSSNSSTIVSSSKQHTPSAQQSSTSQHKPQKAARKAIRSCLFGMRVELLYALRGCCDALNSNTSPQYTALNLSTMGSNAVQRVLRSLEYSTDLLHAVRTGTAKGVVRCSLSALKSLLNGVNVPNDALLLHTSSHIAQLETETDLVFESNLELGRAYFNEQKQIPQPQSDEQQLAFYLVLLAQDLWATLPHLNTPQVNLLGPLLHLAVRVSGPRHGLQRVFSLLTAIGRGTAQASSQSTLQGEHGRFADGLSDIDSDRDSDDDQNRSASQLKWKQRQEEITILESIRRRNTLQDHERLFGVPANATTSTSNDAMVLVDSDDEGALDTAPPTVLRREALVGNKSEGTVLAELLKIVTEYSQGCATTYYDPVESETQTLLTPDVQGLDLPRLKEMYPFSYSTSVFSGQGPSSWVGKCVFCLFQPIEISGPMQQIQSHASLQLLLNSRYLPQVKRASAINLAAKWIQRATRDLALLLKELLVHVRAKEAIALQIRKQRRKEQNKWIFLEDYDEVAVEKGEPVAVTSHLDVVKSISTDKIHSDSIKKFAYLTYILNDLGPAGFTTIREWLLQQAAAAENDAATFAKNGIKRKNSRIKSTSMHSSLSSSNFDAIAPESQSGSAALAKQQQLLLHRMDQFAWSLRQLLGELDRPRKVELWKESTKVKGEWDLNLPSFFREPLDAADSSGRQLLSMLEQSSDSDSSQGNSDDGDILSNKRVKYSIAKAPRVGFAQQLSNGEGVSGKSSKRIRSRNRVVDQWLAEEQGLGDAFADLEDFLVE